MFKSIFLTAFGISALFSDATLAQNNPPPEVTTHIATPTKIGSATGSFLLWDIYDAVLWGSTQSYDPNDQYALSLTYLRDFNAQELSTASIEEISRIHGIPSGNLELDYTGKSGEMFCVYCLIISKCIGLVNPKVECRLVGL